MEVRSGYRKKQIDVLQNHLLKYCENDVEKQVFHDLIYVLQNSQTNVITKSEIARQYNISVLTLNRRLKRQGELVLELYERFGYTKWRKKFLPAEVECIYKYLGVPPLLQLPTEERSSTP